MVEREHPRITFTRQCNLLGVPRSTLSYTPKKRKSEDIKHMKILKQTYLKDPCIGSRRLVKLFKRDYNKTINRKRLKRLRDEIGMKAIYCHPRTSIPNKEHRKYPYLLRNLAITRSNQVWCTDITYIPMPRGHVYLCCIMDWYSRKILGWEVSNTMDASLCQKALFAAIKESSALPEIINTDQGSQFTSAEWIGELTKHGITISMDGKGRWRDNIYIERFWRSIKYEGIFLNEYSTLPDLQEGLTTWIHQYNTWRPHQALDNKTPQEVYQEGISSNLEAPSLRDGADKQLGGCSPPNPTASRKINAEQKFILDTF